MNCPNCHASIPDEASACPYCGQTVLHVREVVDAELVDRPGQHQEKQRGFYRQVIFTQDSANALLPSCQMGIITLALAFALGIEYGLLAFIGFLFFYGIARLLRFAVNIQMIMSGHPLNPILLQIISWFCCWSLTAWLAS